MNTIAEFINNIVFAESLDNKELERTVESAKSYYDLEEITYADFLEVFTAISNNLSLIEEHNAKIVNSLDIIAKQMWDMV